MAPSTGRCRRFDEPRLPAIRSSLFGRDYNEARLHSALAYLAPAGFAARWRGKPETLNQNFHGTWINKQGLAIRIGRKVTQLFFLHSTAFTDRQVAKVPPEVWIGDAGNLRFDQSPTGTPVWHYLVRYADTGEEIAVPVKAGCNVEDWEIWTPGGWGTQLGGKKFYIQQWNNAHPDRPIDSIKTVTALRPEVPMVLGVTLGLPTAP